MSKVLVNDDFVVEGKFSFSCELDMKSGQPLLDLEGVFESDAGYIPEITSLSNERYSLRKIKVYREVFGSEENTISYYFHAAAHDIDSNLLEVHVDG